VIGRTPAERFERPVVAERLRVGARLFPLLRGRLEVTSLIVEEPLLTLYRRDDGNWEPVLTAGDASTTGGPPLVIEKLRVTRGPGIERASLAVVDARGIELQRIDRLRPVDDQLAAASDRDAEATFSWNAEIDGKRLLAARFPIKVTVTVYDRQGRSAAATREVKR